MPQSKKVKLCCYCSKTFNGNQKSDYVVVSKGLSQHLNSSHQCRNQCGIIRYHNKSMNLIQFLVNSSDNFNKKRRAIGHPPLPDYSIDDLGLTGTSNGPFPPEFSKHTDVYKSSNQINHSLLNNQTLFVGNLPSVSRVNINSLLTNECQTTTNFPEPENDEEESIHSDGHISSSNNLITDTLNDNDSDGEDSLIHYLPPEEPEQNTPVINGHQLQTHYTISSDADEYHSDTSSIASEVFPATATIVGESYNRNKPLGHLLKCEMELMHLLRKNGCPLNLFKPVFEWAINSEKQSAFSFVHIDCARHYRTVLSELQNHTEPMSNVCANTALQHCKQPDGFYPHLINWKPDDRVVEVYVRDFTHALDSLLSKPQLMKETNLSLPNISNPYSYESNPPVQTVSELHHGKWWRESWIAAQCDPCRQEMLVPIILYMDKINLDTHGRLSLTPLNMTLGIFNTATRRQNDAWETIYFHPDSSYHKGLNQRKTQPIDNIENLHRGLDIALSSLKSQCKRQTTFNRLPWNGQLYKVNMKFAVAFVIGDTELHDQLCCKFGARGSNVKFICRHCKCPTDHLINPQYQSSYKLWEPADFNEPDAPSLEYWKSLSHHNVTNSFYNINFGMNPHNIHFATPGKCLHMHQLGNAKRAIECFENRIKHVPEQGRASERQKGSRQKALKEFSNVVMDYGYSLSRQSERCLP